MNYEDKTVAELEDELFELSYSAYLAAQVYTHTSEELEEEFYAPQRRINAAIQEKQLLTRGY
jgi:hypothetical protein